MVVQVALLAERLLAERAQHLQSQVLGSVVAVKIPSGGKQFDNFLLDSIAVSVFVLFFTCIYLSLTIRNKNQRNTDWKTSWLV